jgi:hypothetical protein
MGFTPIIITNIAGTIVINLFILAFNFILTKPSITDSPAIAPTAEDEKPDANRAIAKAPDDKLPNNGLSD